jgi:hypothetical protein
MRNTYTILVRKTEGFRDGKGSPAKFRGPLQQLPLSHQLLNCGCLCPSPLPVLPFAATEKLNVYINMGITARVYMSCFRRDHNTISKH